MNITDNLALQVGVIPNLPTGGVIGTAATTVDITAFFSINQTTAGQNITFPNPTTGGYAYVTMIKNVGAASFVSYGTNVEAGKMAIFGFQNGGWTAQSDSATNSFATPVQIVKAKGKIVVGDFQAPTLTPGAINVVSTTINGGAGTAFARYDVVLTTGAVSSTDYQIQYEVEGNTGEINTATATILVSTTAKTLTGFQFCLREIVGATQNASIRFTITENQILTNTNSKIKATVNAGVTVQLGNIKVEVPTASQFNGFRIGTVTGTITAAVNGMTNYSTGAWFASQNPALALTTTFVHPFGWTAGNDGDYILLTVRDNASSDIYKVEMWTGAGFNNNVITIEKL